MGQDYNVQMKQFNGTDFDNIYPKVKVEGITDIGDNYFTKNETLTSDTAAMFGLGADAVPNEVFAKIPSFLNNDWVKIYEYKTPGSFEYIVPNGITKIGAVIGGGGGSGAAGSQIPEYRDDYGRSVYLTGGASGYISVVRKFDVQYGNKIPVVVGAGGNSVSSTLSNENVPGENGGTSSFNGITSNGGAGGNCVAGENVYAPSAAVGYMKGLMDNGQVSNPTDVNLWDPYLNTYYQIVSGAGCEAYVSRSSGITKTETYSGASGKDGASSNSNILTLNINSSISNTTGISSGGSSIGRVAEYGSTFTRTITSGAGSPGFVFVYALRHEAIASGVSIIE